MRVRLIAVGLAAAAILPVSGGLAATPPLPVGGFGIQLLGAPAKDRSNPLSRLYIVGRLAPGTSISRRVEISNSTRSIAQVALYPAAASLHHGRFGFASGHRPNELSRWTSVSQSALRLPPNGKALATVTVKVPRRASSGERYAVVWAQMTAPASAKGGVTVINRVGVRIYLSIGTGGTGSANFTVGSLHGERSASGRPLVAATVRNTGAQTLTISGSLTLSNGPGGLRLAPVPVQVGPALAPNGSRQASMPLDRQLPRGPWRVELRLSSGVVQRTTQATITFPRPAPAATRSTTSRVGIYIVIGLLAVLVAATSTLLFFRRSSAATPPL